LLHRLAGSISMCKLDQNNADALLQRAEKKIAHLNVRVSEC